jgi:hypothetical protein
MGEEPCLTGRAKLSEQKNHSREEDLFVQKKIMRVHKKIKEGNTLYSYLIKYKYVP